MILTYTPFALNADQPTTGRGDPIPKGTVTGGDDALVTSDGDGGFVECTSPADHAVSFRLSGPPTPAVADIEAIWFETDYRCLTAPPADNQDYLIRIQSGAQGNFGNYPYPNSLDYAHHAWDESAVGGPYWDWVLDGINRPFGTEFFAVLSNGVGVRVTWLRCFIRVKGAMPLRQKQRNDNLARGARRARSTSSMQFSVRQNSYR